MGALAYLMFVKNTTALKQAWLTFLISKAAAQTVAKENY